MVHGDEGLFISERCDPEASVDVKPADFMREISKHIAGRIAASSCTLHTFYCSERFSLFYVAYKGT
jgi:hypothetical protein